MDNTIGAYTEGFNTGYGIAISNQTETQTKEQDDFVSMVCETESEHYRQFSPFEFTAKEFNDADDPDEMWEQYERGVLNGAIAGYQFIMQDSQDDYDYSTQKDFD